MSAVLRLLRWAAQQPGLRRLTSITPLLRLSFALRASLVEERFRFALNELRPGAVTASYRLRGSPVEVTLRHHTADLLVLDEVFAQREYELPPPIAQVLVGKDLQFADLGANIGLFGAWILQRFRSALIHAVEADAANAAIHRRTISANGRAESWRLVEAFASNAAGRVRFVGGLHGTSHLATNSETATIVEAIDVFPLLADSDFIKVDIEGGEWALLSDERFGDLSAQALVVEYHLDHCPEPHPSIAAERALRQAGYTVVHGTRKPRAAAGLMWGYRSPSPPSATG